MEDKQVRVPRAPKSVFWVLLRHRLTSLTHMTPEGFLWACFCLGSGLGCLGFAGVLVAGAVWLIWFLLHSLR